jgi:hypothetical protein
MTRTERLRKAHAAWSATFRQCQNVNAARAAFRLIMEGN